MNDEVKDKIDAIKGALDSLVALMRGVSDDASVERDAWSTLKLATGQIECASGNIAAAIPPEQVEAVEPEPEAQTEGEVAE